MTGRSHGHGITVSVTARRCCLGDGSHAVAGAVRGDAGRGAVGVAQARRALRPRGSHAITVTDARAVTLSLSLSLSLSLTYTP